MFAQCCRTDRVFVDGQSVFELWQPTVLAETREMASTKFKCKYKKSLINWNVTVERNADLIGLMVRHKEWTVVLSGVQTQRDSLP